VFQFRSRKARRKARTRDKERTGQAVLINILRSHDRRLAVIENYLNEIGLVIGAKKRSILLGPHLQDDLEHDIVQRFLDGQPHRTPELAPDVGKDRRQVLRIIKRINRRAKRAEGVEAFAFDPAKRTWRLALDIIDRKVLQ
jgi:hypothetical protein